MANETKWVERGASGGDGGENTPWNITEAFTNATTTGSDSTIVNIKLPPGGAAYDDEITDVLTVVGDGRQSSNRHLIFRGYNTIPGDMDFGGQFYQSALDAHINGITAGSVVPIAGDGTSGGVGTGLDTHLITYASRENIIFMNLSLTNSSVGILINSTASASDTVVFDNLRMGDAVSGMKLLGSHTLVKNCLGLNTLSDYIIDGLSTLGGHCYSCVFDIASTKLGFFRAGMGQTITGNIFIGGDIGIHANEVTITHNLFYDQTVAGIQLQVSNGGVIEHSNIFMPATVADHAVLIPLNSDSLVYSDFSLAYPITGLWNLSQPQFPWYKDVLLIDIHANPSQVMGANALTNINPLLADAANKNYTPIDDSPCWFAGMPDVAGVRSHIGPFSWTKKVDMPNHIFTFQRGGL